MQHNKQILQNRKGDSKKKKDEYIRAYRNHYPLVYNRIYKLTGRKEDTEDICHEVFIELFNNFEEIEEIKNWLMVVVRNQVALYYRRKKNKLDDSFETANLDNEKSYSFENGTKELRIMISEEINNNDNYDEENEKTIFELIAILNYSYKETAAQLRLTRRQVEYKYKKIIKRMLGNLKKKGIIEMEDML